MHSKQTHHRDKKKRIITAALCLGTVALLITTISNAQAPRTIAFQGILTDAHGEPVADGTNYDYALAVRRWAGGAASYAEAHNVTTASGVFSVLLGGGTAAAGTFEDESFDDAVWVQVAIGATALAP